MDQGAIPLFLVIGDRQNRQRCFAALAPGAAGIVRSFASVDDFLDEIDDLPPAIVLLGDGPELGEAGCAALNALAGKPHLVSIVLADRTDHAAVRALLRAGSHDLLPWACDTADLALAVVAARATAMARRRVWQARGAAKGAMAQLSPRERAILDGLAEGLSTKEVARRFDLSPRTVDGYRASLMRRAGAASVADLVRLHALADPAASSDGPTA